MRLQKKVFRIIVGTLLSLSLLISFTTNHRTIRAFENVERRFFEQDMFLLQKYIDEEVKRLSNYVSDWGAWDSMYAFMEARDVSRFDELLNGASLRALDIDFLAVLDEEKNVVVGYFVNDLGGEVPLVRGGAALPQGSGGPCFHRHISISRIGRTGGVSTPHQIGRGRLPVCEQSHPD